MLCLAKSNDSIDAFFLGCKHDGKYEKRGFFDLFCSLLRFFSVCVFLYCFVLFCFFFISLSWKKLSCFLWRANKFRSGATCGISFQRCETSSSTWKFPTAKKYPFHLSAFQQLSGSDDFRKMFKSRLMNGPKAVLKSIARHQSMGRCFTCYGNCLNIHLQAS